MIRRLYTHPLQVINYTELLFALIAHIIAIPLLGVLTGLMCGCAVLYAIRIQADAGKPKTRQAAFYGVTAFKVAQLWIHQTSFLFIFQFSGKTLPFGWPLDTWAWIITVLLFSLDIWALAVTAREANERAAEIAAEQARQDAAEREARNERERADQRKHDSAERLELARIKAEAKAAAAIAAEETARKIAETEVEKERTRAELERKKLENERNAVELARKAEEDARNLAEARRKEEEAERKDAERQRKEEERATREEAKKLAAQEAAERARIEAEAAAAQEALRAKWREQKAKKHTHNGHQPETAQTEAAEA